jgi:hypothetical protein
MGLAILKSLLILRVGQKSHYLTFSECEVDVVNLVEVSELSNQITLVKLITTKQLIMLNIYK